MKGRLLVFALAVIVNLSAVSASERTGAGPKAPETKQEVLRLAQSYSCQPRRYCSRNISSCEEARWYHQNCSWGGALDRDNDGIPCENLC